MPDEPMPTQRLTRHLATNNEDVAYAQTHVSLPVRADDGTLQYLATQLTYLEPLAVQLNKYVSADYNQKMNLLAYAIAIWNATAKPNKPFLGETVHDTDGAGMIGGGTAA